MKIGLCCVFSNEERNLVGLLHSCYRAVDHCILLDNGSTDRSRELARLYCGKSGVPCSMLEEPRREGFPDNLYNRALDEAAAQGCDWILLLDADERLSGACRSGLRKMAENAGSVSAYALSRRTIIEPYCPTAGGEIEPYTDSLEFNENHLRFFRPGAVRYPAGGGPHRTAELQPGFSAQTRPLTPTDITHDRDGWEQMRRDRLRGQYEATDLVPYTQRCGGWYDYQACYSKIVENTQDGETVCELGNYLGRSIVALGNAFQAAGKPNVKIVGSDLYCLNPCGFQHVEILEDACRWLPRVSESVIRAGLGDMVSLLQWPSDQVARLFDDGSVAACWIDACHEYEYVARDLAAWWPRIRSGGLFGGHDYSSPFEPCMRAVDEFAAREGVTLDITTSPGSWLVCKS